MSIIERLNEIERRMQHIDNTNEFKYSRKKTHTENKEITKLKEIIGI